MWIFDSYDVEHLDTVKSANMEIAEKVPILVVGSYRSVETITKLRSIGITNYVLKPIRIIYLQSEMRKKLGLFL